MRKLALTLALTATMISAASFLPVQASSETTTCKAYLRLAHDFQAIGKRKEAEDWYRQALKEVDHCPMMTSVLVEMADFYRNEDNMKRARAYLRRAISLTEDVAEVDKFEVATLNYMIGQTYLQEENYQDAEWHLSNALDMLVTVASKHGDAGELETKRENLTVASCMVDLATCVARTGSAGEANALLARAVQIKAHPTRHQ